jgi:gliding motility-associated-like protein
MDVCIVKINSQINKIIMKNKILLLTVMLTSLLSLPKINFGQAINLGAAADFVFFTIDGAIGDNVVSHSHVTGDVGYENSGAITGFGNVNGVMHAGVDAATTAAGLALPAAIAQINARPVDFFPSGLLGNGDTLVAGVYSIPGAATQNLNLYLDAAGDPTAEFIIKIGGTFSAAANSKIILLNGAMACHVFWKIDDVVSMATGVVMRGNILAGAAINMNTLDTLEGRALTTIGAITIDGVLAYTPIGCGSPFLTGPPAPDLASAACYTIFSSIGALSNTPPTAITGDVGKNNDGDAITGWFPADVTGTLHSTQDASTIQCATDLSNAYNTLNALVPDIELLYPSDFGKDLVLTPHTYLMNSGGAFGPAALTDTVYLDAQNNPDGVFVIKIIGGALTTSTYAKVKLLNGAQSKNVFWMVQGQVDINNYSVFRGTIIVPAGAINMVNTGVQLDGRALSMNGAITTTGLTATASCGVPNIITISNSKTVCAGSAASFTVTATGTNLTYQWRKGIVNVSNGATISGATTATLIINPAGVADSSSVYNVIVSGTILPNDTSTNVALVVNPLPIAVATTNSPLCPGDSIYLTAQTVAGATYSWTGPEFYSSSMQNPVILSASVTELGTYSLTVLRNGCPSLVSTTIIGWSNCTDTTDFNIPEGFSPNGDGINDLFVIRGIDNYQSNTFVIFNRWGVEVFSAKNYQNTWDGKSTKGVKVGGDELPVGTYFYILHLNTDSPAIKGTIYLNN